MRNDLRENRRWNPFLVCRINLELIFVAWFDSGKLRLTGFDPKRSVPF
jgi:hypothetical protein